MTAISIIPKQVEIIQARSREFTKISWRTNDDPFLRRLQIIVNDCKIIEVSGADYDKLGQWDDADIKQIIIDELGLEEA